MRNNSLVCIAVLSVMLSVLCSCTPQSEEDRFIDDLLSRMTLEEKIGQMNQFDPSWDSEVKEQLIREGKVGSVFNIVGAEQVNRLQRMAVEQTRLGIPLVAARDVIHGFRTIYPIPLGQAASWNTGLVEQAARLTAQEAAAEGIRWTFSPMVDVCILKFVRGESGNTEYKQMTISPTDVLSITTVDKQGENKTAGLVKLQTVAKVRRGITTGFNKLFVNPTLFTRDHLVEILSSPKDIQGFSTNHCKLDTMLAIKDGDVLNEDETNYLENCSNVILKEGKPQTLKSMIEKGQPWYYITLPETAQIIFSYIVRSNLKFVLNEGRYNVRDNFYMISSLHNQYLLLALLNNYHVFRQLELCGKSYGKGVLKLQTYDISDIKIPHPTALLKEDTDRLIKLSEDLVATSDEDKIEAISDILNPYYGEEDAKDIFLELKSKRLAKYE